MLLINGFNNSKIYIYIIAVQTPALRSEQERRCEYHECSRSGRVFCATGALIVAEKTETNSICSSIIQFLYYTGDLEHREFVVPMSNDDDAVRNRCETTNRCIISGCNTKPMTFDRYPKCAYNTIKSKTRQCSQWPCSYLSFDAFIRLSIVQMTDNGISKNKSETKITIKSG